MSHQSVRILATWLCVATFLLGGMAPELGFVLCLGMDGHIDLSSLGAGCTDCEDESQAPKSGPCSDGLGLSRGLPCCPCVDIPVISVGDVSRQKTTRVDSMLANLSSALLPAYLPSIEGPTKVFRIAQP